MLLLTFAKKVAKFRFLISKQSINSGSCVIDLEQWTDFKSAATGCLSSCRGTNDRSGLPEPTCKDIERKEDDYTIIRNSIYFCR